MSHLDPVCWSKCIIHESDAVNSNWKQYESLNDYNYMPLFGAICKTPMTPISNK